MQKTTRRSGRRNPSAIMQSNLRETLVKMAEEDRRMRAQLASNFSLFLGYHPQMEAVHRQNATALMKMIDHYGWPGRSLVGEEGAAAAWLILQHAIGEPALQRRGLELLRRAVSQGEAPPIQVAMLEDRILVFEGKPQRYGTQFDWDSNGLMVPCPIDDIANVDERRKAVGLGPLEEEIQRRRKDLADKNETPPVDWQQRQQNFEKWAKSVGWR